MKKYKILIKALVCVLIIGAIIFFIILGINKIISFKKEVSFALESAIAKTEQTYPGYEFYVSNISKATEGYYITLKVDEYKLQNVKIKCYVIPKIMDTGYYYSSIFVTTNTNLLTEKHGQEVGSIVPD